MSARKKYNAVIDRGILLECSGTLNNFIVQKNNVIRMKPLKPKYKRKKISD